MTPKREKVVVAMSGGVDSSVAACLLQERGYEVMGLFMRVGVTEPEPPADRQSNTVPGDHPTGLRPRACPEGSPPQLATRCSSPRAHSAPAGESDMGTAPSRSHQGCCSASDAGDARFVAGMLGIPFYALNFQGDFEQLIDYFADEYVRGRTPNPCVVCNSQFKFGKILDYADAVGARYIATGHYARIEDRNGAKVLRRGRDARKDQSYVLFGLDRDVLERVLFPVGELTKAEVRSIATRLSLPNRNKPDSVEICFVPDRDYVRVVRERRPGAFAEGAVIDAAGNVVGRHEGIGKYTIGQRRGLGIAAGKPIYVTELNVAANTVTVGEDEALLCPALLADKVNYLVDPPRRPFRAAVKIRYLHTPAPATVCPTNDREVRVVFDEPQRAITPGQAVVFYDGDVVIGGGWIDRAAG